jgi:hypothetical protein
MGNSKKTYSTGIKIIGFTIIVIATIILSALDDSYVRDAINEDYTFQYVTSITGIDDDADVYKTHMSVPETANYIISLVTPLNHTDLNDQNNIQLFYEDEYVLVYKGEDGGTLVQVSSRQYVHRSGYGGIYRAYSKNTKSFFDKTYKSSKHYKDDIKKYGNINGSNSIRSGSTKSKSNLGGGTSFGK